MPTRPTTSFSGSATLSEKSPYTMVPMPRPVSGSRVSPIGPPNLIAGNSRRVTKYTSATKRLPPVNFSSSRERKGTLLVSRVWRPGPSLPTTWPSLKNRHISSACTVSCVIIRMFVSGYL